MYIAFSCSDTPCAAALVLSAIATAYALLANSARCRRSLATLFAERDCYAAKLARPTRSRSSSQRLLLCNAGCHTTVSTACLRLYSYSGSTSIVSPIASCHGRGLMSLSKARWLSRQIQSSEWPGAPLISRLAIDDNSEGLAGCPAAVKREDVVARFHVASRWRLRGGLAVSNKECRFESSSWQARG